MPERRTALALICLAAVLGGAVAISDALSQGRPVSLTTALGVALFAAIGVHVLRESRRQRRQPARTGHYDVQGCRDPHAAVASGGWTQNGETELES